MVEQAKKLTAVEIEAQAAQLLDRVRDRTARRLNRAPLHESAGRYEAGRGARATGLAELVPEQTIRTNVRMVPHKKRPGRLVQKVETEKNVIGTGIVERPDPDPKRDPLLPPERMRVPVNRRSDVLEQERSHGRISEDAYLVGSVLRGLFERRGGARGAGAFGQGGKVDMMVAHELAILLAIDDARTVVVLLERFERVIGTSGARFLRDILASGMGFTEYTVARYRTSEPMAVRDVKKRFRWTLEDLAADWMAEQTARGPEEAPIRGVRSAPAAGEEHDVNGVVVPEGQGYRVAAEEAGPRWEPAARRRPLEHQAAADLARQGQGRRGRRTA